MISPRTLAFWSALGAGAGVSLVAGAGAAVAVAAATAGAGLVLANALVDPHRVLHRPFLVRPYYSRPRHLNPGLARTDRYDTAVLGNSLVENLRPAAVERILGGRCRKLPTPGASAREISMLLEVVRRAGRAKRVLLAADPFLYRGPVDRFGRGRAALPAHLYRRGPVDLLRYLLSADTFVTSYRIVRRSFYREDRPQFDPEQYGDEPGEKTFSAAAARSHLAGGGPAPASRPEDYAEDLLVASFDVHLLRHVDAAPDVEFIVWLPPWSVLAWVHAERRRILDPLLAFRARIADAAARRPNLRLFDFAAEEALVTDLDSYRDLIHYSEAMNVRLLERIAAGGPPAGPESVRAGNERIRALVTRARREPGPPPSARSGR